MGFYKYDLRPKVNATFLQYPGPKLQNILEYFKLN
jgi:hypothetical protein